MSMMDYLRWLNPVNAVNDIYGHTIASGYPTLPTYTPGVNQLAHQQPQRPMHVPQIPLHPVMMGNPYGIPLSGNAGIGMGMPNGMPTPGGQWYSTAPIAPIPPVTVTPVQAPIGSAQKAPVPQIPVNKAQKPGVPQNTSVGIGPISNTPQGPPNAQGQMPQNISVQTPEQRFLQNMQVLGVSRPTYGLGAQTRQANTPDVFYQLAPGSYANSQAIQTQGNKYSDDQKFTDNIQRMYAAKQMGIGQQPQQNGGQ